MHGGLTFKRLVIKISSSLLVSEQRVDQAWLDSFVQDVATRLQTGQSVMLVTSGAVALGRRVLHLPTGPLALEESQAAAACGQAVLMRAYQDGFARHDRPVAQLLLTPHDTEARQPYLHARAALRNLLKRGVVPIINENDAVTMPALRFTDNDQLAARVAAMVEADALILLSDIDGLYGADPRIEPDAPFIPEVRELTPDIMAMAGGPRSATGRGGMITKLAAARTAMKAGCAVAIAKGSMLNPLRNLIEGGRATWFIPDKTPVAAWKIWIGGSLHPRGSVTIDAGAEQALRQGKSLLAVGITAVDGEFEPGDPVRIVALKGTELARGLITYGSTDVRRLMGRRSAEFAALLGYAGDEAIIHRDDMALL